MGIVGSEKFYDYFNQILAFEREAFGESYVFYARQMIDWWKVGAFFYALAAHPQADKLSQAESLVAGASMILISDDAYEDLLANRIRANQMRVPQPKDKSCWLYLNTLVTFRADLVPALIKRLLDEVRRAKAERGLALSGIFCIPVNPVIERKLKRMGFSQVGFYRGRYPVMGVSGDQLTQRGVWKTYFSA